MSNETQHTPGPWNARPTASLGPQWVVYPEADGPDIAIIYDHGNTEANAHLIAAAPELLEACRRIAVYAQSGTHPHLANYLQTFAGQQLINAIAKAEGR